MPFDDMTIRTKPEIALLDKMAQILAKPEIALLDKVRDLLATPEKWCKNALEHDGRHCVYGALNLASYGDCMPRVGAGATYKNVERALVGETVRSDIILFNNAPHTEHADILALIDRARDRLLAKVG